MLGVEAVHLYVTLRQLAHDLADVPGERLVGLGRLRLGHVNLHLLLLEQDSIAKHFCRRVLVKVAVCALRVATSANVVWDVRCAVRLREQVVFSFAYLII